MTDYAKDETYERLQDEIAHLRKLLAAREEPPDEVMRLRHVLARIAITRRGASSPEVYEETIRRWADDALRGLM